MTTDTGTVPAWRASERFLTGFGIFLIVIAVGSVLGAIGAAAAADRGMANFVQTMAVVGVGVLIGIGGGAMAKASVRRRIERGVVLASD